MVVDLGKKLEKLSENLLKELVSEFDALELATDRRQQFLNELEVRLKKKLCSSNNSNENNGENASVQSVHRESGNGGESLLLPIRIVNMDLTEVILSRDLMDQL